MGGGLENCPVLDREVRATRFWRESEDSEEAQSIP